MLMSYLKVSNFTKIINKKKILDDISFELENGKVLVILGKSGAGKTTLLRNINFLDFPDIGTLELDGEILYNYINQDIDSKELQRVHKLIGLVFQSFNLFPHYSVIENIMKPQMLVLKKSEEDARDIAISLLKRMDLEQKANNYPCELSGGQQQRVSIARAMALKPEVLLFDEPTSALDPELTGEILEVIKELASEKMTMVVVTHEMNFAKEISDKVIFMDNGFIVAEGSPKEVIENPLNERVISFLSRVSK